MAKVPDSRLKAAAIARAAWSVKPGQHSVQGRLRVPAPLLQAWNKQTSSDRGSTWAEGYLVRQNILLLYRVLEALSGHGASLIVGNDITLIVGQESFTTDSSLNALLLAIAHYLPPKPADDLEPKLKELDLLE